MNFRYIFILILFFSQKVLYTSEASTHKIVGLINTHNEANVIEQNLRTLACYTDAIVVLDNASHDETVATLKKLATELPIEQILENSDVDTELNNKQKTLEAGRHIGGTHFIFADTNEIFSATCLQDNWLRNQITSLAPGQVLTFPIVNLWNGNTYYRPEDLASKAITNILCDDGQYSFLMDHTHKQSPNLHISEEPLNILCKTNPEKIIVDDLNYCIICLKNSCMDYPDTVRAWSMCLEQIRSKATNPTAINKFYSKHTLGKIKPDDSHIKLQPIPEPWLTGYQFFDASFYAKENSRKKYEIIQWIKNYELKYFNDLEIWDIPWLAAIKGPSRELYQDIIINNEIINKGVRECNDRYQTIKSVLDLYKRPITVLDIGASQGYFSFKIAAEYDATCVMIEGGYDDTWDTSKQLLELCKLNNKLNNIIYLQKRITPAELEHLGTCEHFDVVIAFNIIHHFGKQWQRTLEAVLNLGNTILIESPAAQDAIAKNTPIGPIEDYLKDQGSIIGKFSRHTDRNSFGNMYLINRKKDSITRKVWYEKNSNRIPIVSNYHEKYICKGKISSPWARGINTVTFKMLNGAYPTADMMENMISSLATKYALHKDFVIWNMILQGNQIVMIDDDDQGRWIHNLENCLNFNREFLKQKTPDDVIAYMLHEFPKFLYKLARKKRDGKHFVMDPNSIITQLP